MLLPPPAVKMAGRGKGDFMAAGAVPQIGDGPARIDMAAPLLYSKTAERWKMPQWHPGSSLSRGLLPRILFL